MKSGLKNSMVILSSNEMEFVGGGQDNQENIQDIITTAEEVEKDTKGFFSACGLKGTTLTVVSVVTTGVLVCGWLAVQYIKIRAANTSSKQD